MRTLIVSLITLLTLGGRNSSLANSVVPWGSGLGTNCPTDLANVTAIAAGSDFSIALLADGTVRAWGSASNGRTGVPGDLSNVVAVAAGYRHGLALKSDSTVRAWGWNSYNQSTVPQGLSNVVAVAGGELHSLALLKDGTIRGWGQYYDPSQGFVALDIGAGLSNVMAIAAGYNHDVMLLSNGTVVAVGIDSGLGQTQVPDGLSNVVAVAAYGDANLALTASGRPVAWGDNSGNRQTVPATLTNAAKIAVGLFHDLALRRDGTVKGWGNNDAGQSTSPTGLSSVLAIAAGEQHSLALVANVAVAPTIFCPADLALAADAGQCSRSNVSFTVTATNAAGSVMVVSQPPSGSTFAVGTTTVTNTATDGQGNSTACTFTVTVTDSEAPVILCPTNMLLVADAGQCSKSTVTFVVGANDNCGSAGVVSVPPSGSTFPVGTTVVTNTATDAHGTRAVCTFTVTVTDGEAPVIYCPGDMMLAADAGQCSKSNVTFAVSATDNCGSAGVITVPPSGATFPVGTTTVTNTATDAYGNKAVCTFTVTVIDNEKPVMVCPTNLVLVADAGQHSRSNVTFVAGATDNCGSPSVISVPPSGSTFPMGTTFVTNTATDNHGNQAVCTFAVTVTDGGNSGPVNLVVPWGSGPGTNCPSDLGNVTAIAAGSDFSIALQADGTVRAWGNNTYGQTSSTAALSNVVAVAAGYRHGLALISDGTVTGWGWNNRGQKTPPMDLSNVVAVAGGEFHSLALLKDGTVRGWGQYYDLSQVAFFSIDVGAGLTNVMAIAAGYNHDVMLLSNGTVVARGINVENIGQTQVPDGLSNVVAIAAYGDASLALSASGRPVHWGDTSGDRQIVPATLTNAAKIAVGLYHDLALRRDGTVKGWGNNDAGQSLPPGGLTNVIMIAAGEQHSLALVGIVTVAPEPPSPQFSITNPRCTNRVFTVTVPTVQGRSYHLEYKNSLSQTNWIPLDTMPGDGTLKVLTDPAAGTQRFYRVKQW